MFLFERGQVNVLIIGNDLHSLEFLAFVVRQGYLSPMMAHTVSEALALHERTPAGLVLIEMNAALADLLELCSEVRQKMAVPIIVIAPWSDEQSQLQLYGAGADDYVTRPYSPAILEAKIRAFLRMSGWIPPSALSLIEKGVIRLDPEQHTFVVADGVPVRLTPLEFRLLYVLILNVGHVLSAETLVEKVWGYTGDGNRDLLKGLVRRLRGKIEPDVRVPVYIRTVPGVGYAFSAEGKSQK